MGVALLGLGVSECFSAEEEMKGLLLLEIMNAHYSASIFLLPTINTNLHLCFLLVQVKCSPSVTSSTALIAEGGS